jgi:hypothetical protein
MPRPSSSIPTFVKKSFMFLASVFIGGGAGIAVHRIPHIPENTLFAMAGAAIGCLTFIMWPTILNFLRKVKGGHWRITEVVISGVTFKSDAAQRKAAWQIFFNIVSRIAIRRMEDHEGDDGAALGSLKALFDESRKIVCDLDYEPMKGRDSVEAFTLEMLNSVLAPFLTKWHPKWDSWKNEQVRINAPLESARWPEHGGFRTSLKDLQSMMRTRAKAFAMLAEVESAEQRFIPPPPPPQVSSIPSSS